MRRNILLAAAVLTISGLGLGRPVFAQTDPTPQTQAAAPAKTEATGELRYEVSAVTGNVRFAPIGTDPLQDAGWQKIRLGDQLGAGMQIHVPAIRAGVKLTARPSEPPTVILIERGTLIGITELNLDQQQGTAKSRVKLAYGAVRAGVAEGATRSDMEIESPVATLSKRGTDIFRFEYRNGRFLMSLSEQGRGLIQAIQTRSGEFGGLDRFRSRYVTPGQFVTHQMMRAIEHVQFERTVNINDAFGLQGLDAMFTMLNSHGGLAFLLPQGSNLAGMLDGAGHQTGLGLTPSFDQQAQAALNQLLQTLTPNTRSSPAGDFGIGQGQVPGILDARSKALQAHKNLPCMQRISQEVREAAKRRTATK